MTRLVVNIVGFQAGWFAAILLAGAQRALLGVAVILLIVGVNLALSAQPAREARAVLIVAAIGASLDTAIALMGLLDLRDEAPRFLGASSLFIPWIFALWLNFAATLNVSMRWLRGRPLIAGALGALGAPGTYLLAHRLGAVELHSDIWPSLLAVGVEYAVALPLLVLLAQRIASPRTPEASP